MKAGHLRTPSMLEQSSPLQPDQEPHLRSPEGPQWLLYHISEPSSPATRKFLYPPQSPLPSHEPNGNKAFCRKRKATYTPPPIDLKPSLDCLRYLMQWKSCIKIVATLHEYCLGNNDKENSVQRSNYFFFLTHSTQNP